jgi:hypothetical protein
MVRGIEFLRIISMALKKISIYFLKTENIADLKTGFKIT